MNAPEAIPFDIHTLHSRLRNWARACRYGFVRHTCGSMEKMYHCPQVWESQSPKLFIDSQDAESVEKAWRTLQMRHKMILKWAYVYPVHPRLAERKANIEKGGYESQLRLAEFKIAVILKRSA